jgi:Ca2+-binding EF-hand superfamily protein
MVNYKKFNKTINPQYDTRNFTGDLDPPKESSLPETSFFATAPAPEESLIRADGAMKKLAPVYKTHEIDIRASYKDFDVHNLGLVTEKQFFRNFPEANQEMVNESDWKAIADKYRHPEKKEMIRYVLWRLDQDMLVSQLRGDVNSNQRESGAPRMEKHELTAPEVIQKIKDAVYKNGIRTKEYFKDHDKLRSGNVTRNQFIRGLSDCCSRQAQLTAPEMETLASYLTVNNIGDVCYRDFCDGMEHAYSFPSMEKHPNLDLYRPTKGALYTSPNTLSEKDEADVQRVLDKIAKETKEKRIDLHAYFKDFDHNQHYTSGITKTQFGRELKKAGYFLDENELDLVCRKYEVVTNHGDVHYPHFCERVDTEYRRNNPVGGTWNTTIY